MALSLDNRYIYEPLESLTSFRILSLLPGIGDDPLCGSLSQIQDLKADLERYDVEGRDEYGSFFAGYAADLVQFEALSYVWGPATYTSLLRCPEGVIRLTPTLDAALRHVRRHDRPRSVWADGVCIDQEDKQEQGHQVRLMGDIYSRADRVLVWLGLDNSLYAKEVFGLALRAAKSPLLMKSVAMRSAISTLVECEWFSRLWVVQEFLLANFATFYWGDEALNFEYLQKPFRYHIATLDSGFGRWVAHKFREPNGHLDFMEVLSTTRGLRCSKEQDRFYAILGLPYGDEGGVTSYAKTMKPDYNKSADQQYLELAQQCVEHGALEILLSQVCSIKPIAPMTGLPSWIPDWSMNHGFVPLPYCLTERQARNLGTQGSKISLDNHTLLVQGSCTNETVCAIGDDLGLDLTAGFNPSIFKFWQEHVQSPGTTMFVDQYRAYETEFLQTLMCLAWEGRVEWPTLRVLLFGVERLNCFRQETRDVAWMLSSLEMSTNSDNTWLGSQEGDAVRLSSGGNTELLDFKGKETPQLRSPQRFWRGRRLFKTSGNLLGLGPAAMRKGDHIFRLHQCFNPVILRIQDGYNPIFIGLAFMPKKPKEPDCEITIELT